MRQFVFMYITAIDIHMVCNKVYIEKSLVCNVYYGCLTQKGCINHLALSVSQDQTSREDEEKILYYS